MKSSQLKKWCSLKKLSKVTKKSYFLPQLKTLIWRILQSVPGIMAFIAIVSCSKVIFFHNLQTRKFLFKQTHQFWHISLSSSILRVRFLRLLIKQLSGIRNISLLIRIQLFYVFYFIFNLAKIKDAFVM
jgi:hypothetical protein